MELSGTSAAGLETHDFEDVAAFEAGVPVQDAGGRLESGDATFGRARLSGQKRAAGARRDGLAMDEERQHRKPWVAAFHG